MYRTLMKFKFLLLVFFGFLLTVSIYGQRSVSGNVTDAGTGEALIGATIQLKGTAQGTITDVDGNYTIQINNREDVLIYSYIGYDTKEEIAGERSRIDVSMALDATQLDEIVVIGYGTQKKDDLTGSIAVVSGEDLNRTNSPTIERALQGKAAGVLVTRTSGHPGSGVSVKVRGIGSINRSSEPLYILDGVPVGDMSGISPEDIESVQVLKDASATAIYGARGANGVVLIKTKRGEGNDKMTVDFSSYLIVSQFPESRWYDVMDANEYAAFTSAAHDSTNPDNKPFIIESDSLRNAYGNTNTDWQDELLRRAFGQNHFLRVSNGNDKYNVSVSGNYYNEEGVMINTDYERFNLRVNSDFKLFNGIVKIGESLLVGNTNEISSDQKEHESSGVQGNRWAVATLASPLMPLYEPGNIGGYAGPTDSINGHNEYTNPVAEQALRNRNVRSSRILGNYFAEVRPFKGFTYKLNIGHEVSNGRQSIWVPEYELGNIGNRSKPFSDLTERSSSFNRILIENLFNYNARIRNHFISVVAGHTTQHDTYDQFSATGQNFRDTEHNVLSQAEIRANMSGSVNEHKIESYLARLIYDYRGKYLLTASIRRDGSSRFGKEGERYGNFPSFSVGWKLNEDLLRSVDEIGLLKLRFGWGHTGNMNIGNYAYESTLLRPDASRYLFGVDETLHLGVTDLNSTGNPVIKWEHAIMTNFGFDLHAFRNKVAFTAEYYIKNQEDMLVQIEIPLYYGKNFDDPNSNVWVNLGKVQNRGVELNLTFRNKTGNLSYDLSGNFTTIKNSVLELPEGVPIYDAYTITTEGHSIGSFYGYIAEGIFQSEEEIELHASQSASPGDIKFRDLNNDGTINDLDRTIIGKPLPDFTYGFNIDLAFKGLDIGLFLYGMHNLDVYNQHRTFIGTATDKYSKDFNKLREVQNYWTPENHSTTMTRISTKDPNRNTRMSSWFVENASFLRVQSLQVGYSFPVLFLEKAMISKLRIYVNASNLYVFSKYSGYDPEVGSTDVLQMGVDEGNYPIPRTISFGIQLGL
ncbi:MAG: TonB-dependent receptor [Bacteroidales bacterium]|nr:TonB-dependent receptor [Bacteroidales bacterium]